MTKTLPLVVKEVTLFWKSMVLVVVLPIVVTVCKVGVVAVFDKRPPSP